MISQELISSYTFLRAESPGGNILGVRQDDFPELMGAHRGFFLCGILILGASNIPAFMGAPGEPFPCGILPLGADASRRLWEPQGIFSLRHSSPGARCSLAFMGAPGEFFPR